MSTNTKRILFAITMALAVLGMGETAYSLQYPHNAQGGLTSCQECHSRGAFKLLTSFDILCINAAGCHNSIGGIASKKALSREDASDRFGNISVLQRGLTGKKHSSHGWNIPNVNASAGVPTQNNLGQSIASHTKKIYCTRCHRVMGGTGNDKFLRKSPTGNYICMECHSARKISNVRDYNAGVESGTLHYSHPVEVNYSTARAAKPDYFNATPQLAAEYSSNESARPRLYTTHETAPGGKKKGGVVCQTCHGPIHSADSNPYTFDNLSAWSRGVVNYSSSAGNLLRQYDKNNDSSNNLCKSCHTVQTHRSFNCYRCHTPHKKAGEKNRYLILETISTPYSGKRAVQFISTSAMAQRYGTSVSNKMCQVCHTGTDKAIKYHRNYSTPDAARDHNMKDPGDYTKGYKFCPKCHVHSSGFLPTAGCAGCHSAPPFDTYSSGASTRVIGKHAKHVKDKSGNDTGASYDWSEGELQDDRSANAYGFSCGRCHAPWAPYTSSADSTGRHRPANWSNDNLLRTYTAEIGFETKADQPLPKNPGATYNYGTRASIKDWGNTIGGSNWSVPAEGGQGQCRNLYCHGQFFNGYTANNPTFTGNQPCGSCHGAKRNDPPGKKSTASANYGAHPRHVGNANNQQYNSAGWKFGCNACHYPTVMSSVTSIDDRSTHVDGRLTLEFNGGGYGNAASTYGGFADYTSRKPAMYVKPAYKTCAFIYCHSDGSRTQGNYSSGTPYNSLAIQPNWSSSRNFTSFGGTTTKRRCARCHGNTTYKGITAAMPGYVTRAGKGNSHEKHIQNGFLCRVCHSSTVNTDNKSIASTVNHVNKFYNISIISAYRTAGNNYNTSTKQCSNVKCHAGETTPEWGTAAVCQDCHLSNTGDTDKRISANNKFQSFTGTAPKIYSTAWAEVGHGRPTASGNYPSGNPAANRVCTDCHNASVLHGTANNRFRLYTINSATGNPNTLCEDCHGIAPGTPAFKTGIQTHASTVVGSEKYNFSMKCIDCHDPHGDNNRFMVHSTVARPSNSLARKESSNAFGSLFANATGRNVDFTNSQYTSDYARKFKSPKICQVCHTQTKDPSPPYGGRFRWYSAADKTHGGARCTNCHSHSSGFKGAGCDSCHGWPPTSLQNIISGAGRINPTKKRASGSATAGAHFKHYTQYRNTNSLTETTLCGLCHKGGMYPNGAENINIDLGFNAFGIYTTGKYRGQSAVATGYYGYSGVGAGSANNTYRCETVKCHGGGAWLTKSLGNITTPRWNDGARNSVYCGSCHGAKKVAGSGTWPTTMRHTKHAGTSGSGGYDFMCRVCHADTVMGTATTLNKQKHADGKATFKFYTGTFTGNRLYSGSSYDGDDVVNSGWGKCENLYCHSRGTTITPPYNTAAAYPNYTARWDLDISGWNAGERCSLCHGSDKTAGGYAGITSAMPNQANQAHKKHVVDNGFKCYVCHSATVNNNNAIVSITNHVNRFKNISIIGTFKQGQTMYSSSLSSTNKTCKNVRCHAGNKTPDWTVAYDTIKCGDCHYSSTSDTDNFTFNSFSGTAAKIYSTEWTKRGHGKSRSSGKYAFSNNSGAGKTCTNCHEPTVKHGASNNYFRLLTSNSDRLCLNCHGNTPALGSMGVTISNITGIQSHTWANMSTSGYNGGKIKAASRGGWNFGQHDGSDQKKVKCVDCHDPHGDRNNYMIHSYINMSGSDRVGRPNPNAATAQMVFTAVGGPQMNWSSYVKSSYDGICQRCHSNMMSGTTSIMDNFNKAKYSNHNRTNRCTKCHNHKKGFTPSGCDGCHGYPPPDGPTAPNNWAEEEASPATVGLHEPHAWNSRQRPGIPTDENDVDAKGGKGANERGFNCNKCHADTSDGADPTMGDSGNVNAIMTQLTSVYGDWSPGADGYVSVTDDTCSNITCHTPRSFTRTWKKPSNCNGCHGFQNKTSLVFELQTTASHKAHIHYTSQNDYKKRKYGFRCTMCHIDNSSNYSTHYNSNVNMNFRFGLSTAAVYNRFGNTTSFKGWTSGGELATCSKVYCHGRFSGGTTITQPKWGNKFTGCSNCHKSKGTTPGDGSAMPERHPKHVGTAAVPGYNFACVRCHSRTVGQANLTTIIFNYSSHVNARKDIYFDNQGGIDNTGGTFASSARQCSNTYCHSKGYRSTGSSFNTRTTIANYTADWDVTASGRTSNRPCSFCHGNNIYNGITAAMPNQTSLWGNSHRTHVIKNNFRCVNCHAATVSSAGVINNAGGRHVDGFKTITIIASYKAGATNYGAGKTCDNVRCHALKTTPKWGTYIRCQDCHLSNTGDTDKRISANNTFQSFTGKTVVAPRIYSTAWANTGHGASGAYGSGNSGANKTCTDCHSAAVNHGTAANPFRLYTAPGGNPNRVCEGCHGTNPWVGGGSTKTGIQTHASSVVQTGRHNFAIKCIDCHDPHGDNNTRFMAHSTVARPRLAGTRAEISNAYGNIFYNATARNVDFTQNEYSSDYAKKVTSPKICQVCHTRTFKPNSTGKTRFRWNGSNDLSHGAGKCGNCHSHSQGFKGAACDACHGFPPTSANNLIGRPGTNETRTMSGSTTAGAHQKHVTVFGSSNDTCNKCHSGGMAFNSQENDDITLKFEAFSLYTGANQKYTGQAAVRTGFYGYSGDGITTDNTLRCNSVKCHGGGGWLTASYGAVTAPKWDDKNTAKCGKCHGAKKAPTSGSWPTTNAHETHAGTGSRQLDLMCKVCHNATVQNQATSLNYANHINGQANVSFGTTEPRADGSSAYSDPNGATNNSVIGKCTSVYCHSRGTDRVAPYDAAGSYANFTALWSDSRGTYKKAVGQKAKCNYCHGDKTSYSGVTSAMPNYTDGLPKANKHSRHVVGYNFLCTSCHVNTTVNNTSIDAATGMTNHVNRKYNINFNSNTRTINNSAGTYTSVSNNGRCQSIYCHSAGTAKSPSYALPNFTGKWGDNRGSYVKATAGTMAKCNYCHGNKNYTGVLAAMPNYNDGSPKNNKHSKHVRTYGFLCTSCHVNVTVNNTSIDAATGTTNHVNLKYSVNFNSSTRGINNSAGTYTSVSNNGRCQSIYCHSRGTDFASFALPNYTAKWGHLRGSIDGTGSNVSGMSRCNYCHGTKGSTGFVNAAPSYANNSPKANRHPMHAGSYSFACSVCHERVTANNTSIDASGGSDRHINAAYNVDFNKDVPGRFSNNTGTYRGYVAASPGSKCVNTYCHSRGTDITAPFNTRTSFANWTARWGDDRGGYKKAAGQKAKCNYCHGSRAFSGITAAMPNYSGNVGERTAKANSHRVHVIGNGFLCTTCHNNIAKNNTGISDRTRHVNGFYNISIEPSRRGAGAKVYSMVYNGTGGTCMNNTCHGASKPQWGNPSTASCRSCHLNNKDKDDYWRSNGVKAELYSTEWKKKGHGFFAPFTSIAENRCLRCHDQTIAHNTASNPYRLKASESGALCLGCHGNTTERAVGWNINATNVDYKPHTRANTGGDASWNTHTSAQGKGVKCVDCHDPHGDKNRKMIHSFINHSGSDMYGRPKGRPWTENGQIGYSTAAMMTFTAWGGNLNWSSFANTNVARSICRRCHTPNSQDGNMGNKPSSPAPGNMTKGNYQGDHQSHQKCTGCHSHAEGFKGGGESAGGQSCDGCHGTGDLFEKMRAQDNYHHVMINTSTTYRNVTLFGATAQESPSRRCLMCHVDHDVFSPANNVNGVRARNLRVNARVAGNPSDLNTFINTDFWPAKRKNAVRTGGDAGTANYSSTYPISGPSQYNGVCISCHKNVQYKNTTLVNDAIKTSRAKPFEVDLFKESSHNFQVITGTFRFSDDKSSFRGNCTKCHRTPDNDFSKLSKDNAQDGRYPVALHDKNVPSLMMNIATSSSKPMIERLCYNCHDTASRASGGPGNVMDYYSSLRMNSGAKMIRMAITGKKFVKPIENADMAGRHKIDEFYNATGTVAENGTPTKFWNFSTTRHIECVDCHNTHGGNASIERTPGGPYYGTDRVSGSPVWKNFSAGNKIAGAQSGVWGVSINYPSTGVQHRGKSPAFTKIGQVTRQYEVCLKCHSAYAYGPNPRGVPSGLPKSGDNNVAPFDTLDATVEQSDISRQINPNNFGYHPIYKKGRNQPQDNANAQWPPAKSNWMYKNRFTNRTAYISVSGLSWTFVPPFSQHSLLACTDCHVVDNSRKAVQSADPEGTPTTTGTWNSGAGATREQIAGKEDGLNAVATTASATLQTEVALIGGYPGPAPQSLWVVAFGKTNQTGKNTKTQQLAAYSGGIPGAIIGSAVTVPFGTVIGRVDAEITWTGTWADIDSYSAKITTNSTASTVTLDYLGLEGLYTATSDVRGPHGSMERWILTDVNLNLQFDANNNGNLGDAGDWPNSGITDPYERRVLCYNCHRRDVYGAQGTGDGGALYDYSRLDHPPEGAAAVSPATTAAGNVWGIFCMNCHAGGGIGEIHGSFANSTTNFPNTPGTRVNLGRPRGVRLLNGAMMNFNPVTDMCYTTGAPDAGAGPFTNGCSNAQHVAGVGIITTKRYTYTSW